MEINLLWLRHKVHIIAEPTEKDVYLSHGRWRRTITECWEGSDMIRYASKKTCSDRATIKGGQRTRIDAGNAIWDWEWSPLQTVCISTSPTSKSHFGNQVNKSRLFSLFLEQYCNLLHKRKMLFAIAEKCSIGSSLGETIQFAKI